MTVELILVRDTFSKESETGTEGFTLGTLSQDGKKLCETLELEDRHLETGGEKIHGRTAIPRGRYRLELYNSPKHGEVALLQGVPNFEYVEIHGANKASDLLGCIGVGEFRSPSGIYKCAAMVRLVAGIVKANDEVFLTVR